MTKDTKHNIRDTKIKTYLLLHSLMFLFSLSPVCAKLAGQEPFLSPRFLLFYSMVVGILGLYALLWQQVIKKMPLTTAYAGKAVTVIWGMLWGAILFDERITVQKCIGAAVITAGVLLYAVSDSRMEQKT